jgi:hypothetical protein
VSLFLHQLCVLKSHDQLKFLLFHAGNLRLVQLLLVLLSIKALLDLGASTVLFVDEVHLTLGHCLLLLHFDHGLDLASTGSLIVLVVLPLLAHHLLFSLGVIRILFGLHVGHLLVLVYLVVVLLLDIQIHLGLLALLLHLLLLPHQFLLLHLHIAAALAHDVRGPLTSLVDLLDCLLKRTIILALKLTLFSSDFSRPILLQRSFKSSSARLRAILAATNLRCRVASSSSSYGVRSSSSSGCSSCDFSYVAMLLILT